MDRDRVEPSIVRHFAAAERGGYRVNWNLKTRISLYYPPIEYPPIGGWSEPDGYWYLSRRWIVGPYVELAKLHGFRLTPSGYSGIRRILPGKDKGESFCTVVETLVGVRFQYL